MGRRTRWVTGKRRAAPTGRAILYDIALVEGFLGEKAPKNALVVALGDHQPPGIVSGPGATWLVPVHAFSRDENRIAAFRKLGFRDGFVPSGGTLGDFASLHRKVAEALKIATGYA